MKKFKQIEISFEVHKKIETERRSFEDSDDDVLRRLLGLPKIETPSGGSTTSQLAAGWSWKGVYLPPGTRLRMTYLGKAYEGEVLEGKWQINGKAFRTPSEAAKGLARTRDGREPSLDGWEYWYVRRPEDRDWLKIDSLRVNRRGTAPHKEQEVTDMTEGFE